MFEKEWNAGVYARVSTDHEDQRLSNEHQVQFFNNEWAKQNGIVIHDYYVDDGVSGTSIKKRYQFQKLLDDAENQVVNCIIAKSITRFARNQVDTLQIVKNLVAKGVRFIFLEQGFDSIKDTGLLGLWAWIAEEESRTTSRRRRFGGQQAQKNGRFIGSRTPLGYKSVEGTLTINQDEAVMIRKIFDYYIQGLGCIAISKRMNEQGYKTRKGESFAKTKVQYILQNEAYKGWIVGNKQSNADVTLTKTIANPPEEWIIAKNAHEAIISEEDFDLVQSILKDRSFTMGKKSTNLFAGIVKCKVCGLSCMCKSTVNKKKVKYKHYVCTTKTNKGYGLCNGKSVNEDKLKEVIQDFLNELKRNEELLDRFKRDAIIKIKQKLNANKESESSINESIEKIKKLRGSLVDKYLDGNIPEDLYKMKENQFNEELKSLLKKRESNGENQFAAKDFENRYNEFIKVLAGFENIEETNNQNLRKVIDSIWVDENGDMDIVLKFQKTEGDLISGYGQIVTTVYPQPLIKEEMFYTQDIVESSHNNYRLTTSASVSETDNYDINFVGQVTCNEKESEVIPATPKEMLYSTIMDNIELIPSELRLFAKTMSKHRSLSKTSKEMKVSKSKSWTMLNSLRESLLSRNICNQEMLSAAGMKK